MSMWARVTRRVRARQDMGGRGMSMWARVTLRVTVRVRFRVMVMTGIDLGSKQRSSVCVKSIACVCCVEQGWIQGR